VLQFSGIILEKYGKEGQNVFLFPTRQAAEDCVNYALSPLRKDDICKEDEISLKVFETHVRVYAVFFPAPKTPILMSYWSHPGMGICSRLGEDMLEHKDSLREATDDSPAPNASVFTAPVHKVLQERIAGLLERAPIAPRTTKVSPDDVYLYPTGMASIWGVHKLLQKKYNGVSVLFGFAFHSTIHLFEEFENPGFKFFGNGNSTDIDALEAFIESELKAGRRVTELYAEFPANPLLVTPDLTRLRKLADKYSIVLVIDDTISSFASVDLLGAADIIVSSLTKTFSGYADVMGASAVPSPTLPKYDELKSLFTADYEPTLYIRDAEVLESNSRNYLERSAKLNANAEVLVSYLQTCAENPASCVSKVYYPTVLPSLPNYKAYMRPATAEFTPGYGCLFSFEFESIATMKAFYEVIGDYIHISPHLGAHLTLVLTYVKALYAKTLDWAQEFDLRETQMRVSMGLEEPEELIEVFRLALEAGDRAKKEGLEADPKEVVASVT
jgi:cystathionine gamma-synthase